MLIPTATVLHNFPFQIFTIFTVLHLSRGTLIEQFLKNLGSNNNNALGGGNSALAETLNKLLASGPDLGGGLGGLVKTKRCLTSERKPEADVSDITKGMSFYLDMDEKEARELRDSPSCLIDAHTPAKANARQICSNGPYSSTHRSYSDLLQDYMKECDDLVHYRVLTKNGWSNWAKPGCVVSLNGRGMWKNPNVNLKLTNIAQDEEFSRVEGYSCDAELNLKILAVRRRMCFVTRNMIINRDPSTGTEKRKCDVTMLKLASDTDVRHRIERCAVDQMSIPTANPDGPINKCRCFERAPYRRVVQNCSTEVENPERCQDLTELTTPQKFSLGYLGLCLGRDGSHMYDKNQRGQLSCLASVRSGWAAADEALISSVRDFLVRCDSTILNTVYSPSDGCVYQTSAYGSAATKWTKPQSSELTRTLDGTEEGRYAKLVNVYGVLECAADSSNRQSSPDQINNQRQSNQNRKFLNIWRTTCNVALDMLSGPEEGCEICRFAVLSRITPQLLQEPPRPDGAGRKTLKAYARNVFDCVRNLMDQWYTDPTKAIGICFDKELEGIDPGIC